MPEKKTQQIPFRLTVNDYKMFKKLLIDEGLKFQTFAEAMVQGYLKADPNILRVLKDWKELSTVPQEEQDKNVLSHREREQILDELKSNKV